MRPGRNVKAILRRVAFGSLLVGLVVGGGLVWFLAPRPTHTRVVTKTVTKKAQGSLSGPLSPDQLMKQASDGGLTDVFWLGPPSSGINMQTTTGSPHGQLVLLYAEDSAKSTNSSGYEELLNTDLVPRGSVGELTSYVDHLRKSAVSIQAGDGFTTYVLLPPLATKVSADIVMVSDDQHYIGRLVYGNNELVAKRRKYELIKLAGEIRFSSTR